MSQSKKQKKILDYCIEAYQEAMTECEKIQPLTEKQKNILHTAFVNMMFELKD